MSVVDVVSFDELQSAGQSRDRLQLEVDQEDHWDHAMVGDLDFDDVCVSRWRNTK